MTDRVGSRSWSSWSTRRAAPSARPRSTTRTARRAGCTAPSPCCSSTPAGRILLQQRAAVKTRFPLRWANACCGHPAPGRAGDRRRRPRGWSTSSASSGVAAHRDRGVRVPGRGPGQTGRVEHEYDHVLLGRIDAATPMRPDPAEVATLHWEQLDSLRSALDSTPETYAPWLAGVVGRLSADDTNPTNG